MWHFSRVIYLYIDLQIIDRIRLVTIDVATLLHVDYMSLVISDITTCQKKAMFFDKQSYC